MDMVTTVETGYKMTAEELLRLPDDGWRYELVKGELLKMVPAGPRHGKITMRLGVLLDQHARQHGLGTVYAAETGFRLQRDPDTVRAPDVAFVRQERIPPEGEPEGYWELSPDLAVEVVSPTDSAAHIQAKVQEYLEAGTRLVWVVYPRTQTVVVYRPSGEALVLGEEDMLTGEDVLPGFACRVGDIFD